MSDDDWLFEIDPGYDGQGKSKEQEVDGSMKVVGCLMLLVAGMLVALLIGLVVWIA